MLEGDFQAADIRIGRRRERLVLPPFLLPLYEADAGRRAVIKIHSALNEKEFIGALPVLNSVNIARPSIEA